MQLRTQRGSTAEGRALGRALASRLGGADLSPSGLPPAAVLIVRRLDGLGPLRFQPRAHRVAAGWERAARSRLGDAAGRAARPVGGRLPPAAPAVLFADEAEMWACLALALLDRTAGSSWWWRAILRGGPPPPLPALFAREARHAPAVFEKLAAWHRLGEAAAALAPPGAEAVLAALVHEHALPAALAAPAPSEPERLGSVGLSIEAPPWRAWTPPISRLPRVTEKLVGIGLGLRRAPREVRSASFVRRVESWCHRSSPGPPRSSLPRVASLSLQEPAAAVATETPIRNGVSRAEQVAVTRPPRRRKSEKDQSRSGGVDREGTAPIVGDESAGGACPTEGRLLVPEGRPRPAGDFSPRSHPAVAPHPSQRHETVGQAPPADSIPESEKPASTESASTAREARPRAFPDRPPEAPPRPPAETPEADAITLGLEGIPTRLGGVLYLIHVALFFDLFAAFEEDAGAWAVLEQLARALVPEADPDDRLWPVLAELDGRPAGVPPPVAAGLDGLLPEIRERLAAALGDPSDEALAALVACPGRLWVTATHVDLTAGLDAISLAARRAGLDRDPGWVPALGRIVIFHFEEPY